MKCKDWFVIYDGNKDEYFAVEDKHNGKAPKMIGNMQVVGICSFEAPAEAIEYIRFVHANNPMRRTKVCV